ncbi:MAG TPA: hypothetical protein VGH85_06055 [Mycobacteriales bacterium]|jgi:hypothetical protein
MRYSGFMSTLGTPGSAYEQREIAVISTRRNAAQVLRALAFAACVPYLALKIAWASGSRIGIPDGSTLLEHHTTMIVGSIESALLDSMVVVLALLLTQPWGRRAPVWPLILPAWGATGLLSPIVVGYPLQLGARLLGGTAAPSGGPAGRPFLDEWVFTVVYTGFIVQALALGALFVLYARARWGHLWRGRISELAGQRPTRGVQRATALMASAVVLVPLTAHLLWATGSTSGLTATKIAGRTSDFYALEAAYVLFAVMTVTGLLLVAFPRAGALPLRLPLTLAFVGSAALACWGGYLMITALENRDPSQRITELMNVTYSTQLLAGMLVLTMGAYFFAERVAQRGHGEESVASPDSELHIVLTHEWDHEAVVPGLPG